jgi:hypothetical protein
LYTYCIRICIRIECIVCCVRYSLRVPITDSEEDVQPLARPKHTMKEIAYWLGRMQVNGNDAKSLRAWRQQNGESSTYDVLSQPVRHELNKFFFDVTSTPSKAQRKQLWYDLQMIDSNVRMRKITRWFQNKRQYMKKHYGAADSQSSSAATSRQLRAKLRSSHSSERGSDHDSVDEYDSD